MKWVSTDSRMICGGLTSCRFTHNTAHALHEALHEALSTLFLCAFHWLHKESCDAIMQPISETL